MRFLTPLAAALLCAGSIFAQAPTGIVKSNGIPIPGATVTATQGDKKASTTTDENGRYEFPDLAPGNYTLEVRMFGFRVERKEVTTPGLQELSLQIMQRPDPTAMRARGGQANQAQTEISNEIAAATVAAPPPDTPADSANESFLVNGSISQGLQNGREDAVLPFGQGFGQQFPGGQQPGMNGNTPGAPGMPTAGGPGGGPGGGGFGGGGGGFGGGGGGGRGGGGFGGGGGGGFGGRGGPGGPQGRNRNNTSGTFFGNRARRGRDTSLHGAIFYTYANSAVNAAPFSFGEGAAPKPDYSSSRFGVTIGGPLQLPKLFKLENTFFFLNYFGTRATTYSYNVGTVPTTLERSGNFSQTTLDGAPVQLFNPTTHAPIGNVIPASMLNPAAQGLLNLIPLPNQPGIINNYVFDTSVPQDSDNLNLRLNQNLTKKDRIADNFNLQDRSGMTPYLFGYLDDATGRGMSDALSYTRNVGSTGINVLTWTINRNRSTTVPYFADKENVAAELGINGVSQNPLNYGPPNLTFTNFASLSDGTPSVAVVEYSTESDSFSFVRGSHTVSMGMSYRRTDLNTETDQNGRGTFAFSGAETSQIGANGQPVPGTGYDFADFLIGLPQSSSIRFGDTSTYFRGNQWSAFGQDDWRIRSNLTLLFGVRWEYYSPLSEKYGHISNLDLGSDLTSVSVVVPGQAGVPATLVRPDKHDWAPRLGLAWKPFTNHSLQIRAGYGIYYNPTVYNGFATHLSSQPPFANTASLVAGVDSPLTIQDGLVIPPGKLLNTWAIDPNYQVGYAQSWTFSLQQDLVKSVILDLQYIGAKGTHLDNETIPNESLPGTVRQISDATGFTYETSNANSIYNALQVRVIRRFHRGISVNGTYTFSKSIDNSSTFGGAGNTVAQNPNDIGAERGLSSFDQRHTLNLSYIFTAPKSNHAFLSDWTLSGGITATSGTPFTARVLGNQSNIGGTGSVGSGRAEATGLPIEDGIGIFNLLAFTVPASGTLGDAARNTIPGLPQWSWNSAFGRSFRFGETRRSLEFRLEGTNILNHVNYTSIGTVVNANNYGVPLAASAMRAFDVVLRFRF
ncbi:MAG: TonB-dependent receptor [Bryobacteraceae bacterium]